MILEVFVHTGCASERSARDVAREIQRLMPELQVQIRPVDQDPERAESAEISIVPAFVLDGKLVSVGVPTLEWLFAQLQQASREAMGQEKESRESDIES